MKISYDRKRDTAYIKLSVEQAPHDIALSYTCDAQQINALINLDFSFDGRLLGIEVLDAKQKLPSELLQLVEYIKEE